MGSLQAAGCAIHPAGMQVFGNLTELPQLSCLYLRGNPVTSTTKQYRRTLICTFPRLTYLDERPIFDGERRCAEAW